VQADCWLRPGRSLLPSLERVEDTWLERVKSTLGSIAAVLAVVLIAPHCSGMLLGILDFTSIEKDLIFFG